jgi:Protein of unknown function (DUF3748)
MPTTAASDPQALPMESQLTHEALNHVLDNNDNFSADDRWLAIDTREPAGGIAGNARVCRVSLETGLTEVLHFEPRNGPWGPGVGAANYHPAEDAVDFIRGLGSAAPGRPYEMWRRTGAMVRVGRPSALHLLDARDVTAPFTPGALRGGTHRHEWSGDGQWIGFTYNDALLAEEERRTGRKVDLRTIGVATRRGAPVKVRPGPENNDGEMFSAIIARVTANPRPGSDEISRAFEDAWVGRAGYRRADGSWQKRARAFLGTLRAPDGREVTEVFIADIPDRIDIPGEEGPLEGTPTTMPGPPRGASQRRLTHTLDRQFPGVVLEPRHWVRSSPDGAWIVFLARDDAGVVQAHLVSPNGGPILAATRGAAPIQSCVRWSPDGGRLLYVCGGSIVTSDARPESPGFGRSVILTAPSDPPPTSPVWSHDGRTIAFNRLVAAGQESLQQIFLLKAPAAAAAPGR